MHKPTSDLENVSYKILWNFEKETERRIPEDYMALCN